MYMESCVQRDLPCRAKNPAPFAGALTQFQAPSDGWEIGDQHNVL